MLTAIGGGIAVTVMVADDALVVSATDVAVSVTVAGAGTEGGAVYTTATPEALELADSEPQEAPEQPAPLNAQLTPLFCESLSTVALKECVCPLCTDAVAGNTETEMGLGASMMVTSALSSAEGCVCETAETDTVAGEGTADGAVYIPDESIFPWTESPPETPLTCQVTAVVVGDTAALNFCVLATTTEMLGGFTWTVTVWLCGLSVEVTLPHPQTARTIARKNAHADAVRTCRAEMRSPMGWYPLCNSPG